MNVDMIPAAAQLLGISAAELTAKLSDNEKSDLMSYEDAAKASRLSIHTLYCWASRGRITRHSYAGRVMLSLKEILSEKPKRLVSL